MYLRLEKWVMALEEVQRPWSRVPGIFSGCETSFDQKCVGLEPRNQEAKAVDRS